ncbi:MAG: hypothetical protein U0350_33695 [Caldilineaceae bacterium]
MATYDPKQLLADYAKGALTPEMAAGHSLQHIDKLYEAQAAGRTAWRAEIDALKQQVNAQQATIDRLTAFMEKVLRAAKKPDMSSPSKSDQSPTTT